MGYRFPVEHERRIEFSSAIPPESGSGVRRVSQVAAEETEPAPVSSQKRRSRPSFAAIELVEANMAQDPRFDPDTQTGR
jgi:hypothetical protein